MVDEATKVKTKADLMMLTKILMLIIVISSVRSSLMWITISGTGTLVKFHTPMSSDRVTIVAGHD
jgi:hypothetical protein